MSTTGAPARGPRSDDEMAEATRTLYALVRAAISNDDEAILALLDGRGERDLRTLVYGAAFALLDLVVRLGAVYEVLGEDDRALLTNPAVTEAVLADPAGRAEIEATIAAAQARFTGQGCART
jgi:hypothetical protein